MLTLLDEELGKPKQYILVAHSQGGLIMQLYAHLHPEKVKGLVLLDSASEWYAFDKRMVKPSPPPFQGFPPEEIIPLSTARALFPRAAESFGWIEEMNAIEANSRFMAKYTGIDIEREQTDTNPTTKPFLGNLPLVVVRSNNEENAAENAIGHNIAAFLENYPDKAAEEECAQLILDQQVYIENQELIAQRSTNTIKHDCPAGTHHYIQWFHPEWVANDIRKLF